MARSWTYHHLWWCCLCLEWQIQKLMLRDTMHMQSHDQYTNKNFTEGAVPPTRASLASKKFKESLWILSKKIQYNGIHQDDKRQIQHIVIFSPYEDSRDMCWRYSFERSKQTGLLYKLVHTQLRERMILLWLQLMAPLLRDHFTINFMVKADVGPAIEATIDEIEKSKKHCLWQRREGGSIGINEPKLSSCQSLCDKDWTFS